MDKQTQPNETPKRNTRKAMESRGYYIALALCVAAVGVSGYLFYRTFTGDVGAAAPVSSPSVTEQAEMSVPNTAKPPASAAVGDAAGDAAETPEETKPAEDAAPAAEDEQQPEEKTRPLSGNTVAAYSVDALAYNETMGDWRTHNGVDLAAEVGQTVCAAADGTVASVYEDDFLGTVVTVDHAGDYRTVYANLAENPAVAAGDTVTAGETLGAVGETALLETDGEPHLHFEVWHAGETMDPEAWLPQAG